MSICILSYIHASMLAYIHACIHACILACIYIYIYINVYINTCAPPARVRLCKGPRRRVRIREHALAHR